MSFFCAGTSHVCFRAILTRSSGHALTFNNNVCVVYAIRVVRVLGYDVYAPFVLSNMENAIGSFPSGLALHACLCAIA